MADIEVVYYLAAATIEIERQEGIRIPYPVPDEVSFHCLRCHKCSPVCDVMLVQIRLIQLTGATVDRPRYLYDKSKSFQLPQPFHTPSETLSIQDNSRLRDWRYVTRVRPRC